ncbi:MAG TPA: hypothetical protein PL155_00610 [Candidatus Omnitrophota bacterium]|nr:hypothetical protein [Candidatus Omnitrophota bacterium]HPD85012.1 hypothetical protein [Candidatus Omnitrophota bacterium]HRZ03870.1 hypothetical protein [Candidatus Omnitrophota bacterium]
MEISKEQIEEIINPFLIEMNLELIDLSTRRQGGDFVIEVLVDRFGGGITVEECSRLNRKVIDLMEQKELLSEGFNLEVSSPGLDRPLVTIKDFMRVVSRPVRFFLLEPVGEKVEYAGIVERVDGENIVVKSESGEIVIPVSKVRKGLQII